MGNSIFLLKHLLLFRRLLSLLQGGYARNQRFQSVPTLRCAVGLRNFTPAIRAAYMSEIGHISIVPNPSAAARWPDPALHPYVTTLYFAGTSPLLHR